MTTLMDIELTCDGNPAPVTPFVGRFLAGVSLAVIQSLKSPPAKERVLFELDGEKVKASVDGRELTLQGQGFAHTLVYETIQGMTHRLKGMESGKPVRIQITL